MADKTTTNKKIILTGTPFGWVHRVKFTAGNPQAQPPTSDTYSLEELWLFNNLQSSTYKILKPGTTSSSSNNIDINRADGGIFRFTKESLILDGVTEEDITPADTSADATNKGDITLVINEAPVDSNSWTAFIKDVKDHLDSMFMITIGTGFSHKSKNDAGLRKPDGYIHMIGKINSDIEQQLSSNPTSLTMTFVSTKNSGLVEGAISEIEELFTAIVWKRGGGDKDIDGILPPVIGADGEEILLTGDVLVVTNVTYSYN